MGSEEISTQADRLRTSHVATGVCVCMCERERQGIDGVIDGKCAEKANLY